MPTLTRFSTIKKDKECGVTLIEMIVFIVIISIALLVLVNTFRQATIRNVDPLVRVQALEAAQSMLDEILSLKYDENTPTGGIPACGSAYAGAIACNNTTKSTNLRDVDDYNGRVDTPYTGYTRSVTVVANNNIKLITVKVTTPRGETILLAAERANF
ncbi:MAG TPA: type II secretion system protein [Cellvibrio sp.]